MTLEIQYYHIGLVLWFVGLTSLFYGVLYAIVVKDSYFIFFFSIILLMIMSIGFIYGCGIYNNCPELVRFI